MTDPFLAHVRFSDHQARCAACSPLQLCLTGVELLNAWHRAEGLATMQADEADRAARIEAELDCAPECGANYREDRLEAEA